MDSGLLNVIYLTKTSAQSLRTGASVPDANRRDKLYFAQKCPRLGVRRHLLIGGEVRTPRSFQVLSSHAASSGPHHFTTCVHSVFPTPSHRIESQVLTLPAKSNLALRDLNGPAFVATCKEIRIVRTPVVFPAELLSAVQIIVALKCLFAYD